MKNNLPNEIAPHRKKSETSDTSQSKAKSKHKHEYAECLVSFGDGYWHKDCYCIICGKLKGYWELETARMPNGHYRLLSQEELLEKYKSRPMFVTEKWARYVEVHKSDPAEPSRRKITCCKKNRNKDSSGSS